ncbi:hypothetical protein V6N12_050516 [Hibiscus sabdariffa]|uniref:Uncharacterized protein n=1 Tax=Hibiscus sabdariffa TaxID=183260 RepID=A0ABR2GCS5_9ROSI
MNFKVSIKQVDVKVVRTRVRQIYSTIEGVARAKLILHDDILQEFHYPVKVSYVLQMNLVCFLCNVDEMDFNHTVYAIEKDQPRSFDPVNSTSPCL